VRLRGRFKRLTIWNKLNSVGAGASIVGIPIAILALLVTVYFWRFPRIQTDPLVASGIEELLRRVEEPIYETLKSRFPAGYMLFYSDGTRMTYEVEKDSVAIQWKTVTVALKPHQVIASAPQVRGAGITDIHLGASREPGRAVAAFSGDFQFVLEVLQNRPDGLVGVVGACESSESDRPFCEIAGSKSGT